MAEYEDLINRCIQVINEAVKFGNSKERIGQLIADVVSFAEKKALTDLSNVSEDTAKKKVWIRKYNGNDLDFQGIAFHIGGDWYGAFGVHPNGSPLFGISTMGMDADYDEKYLAFADMSNVPEGSLTPEKTTFANLINNLHYAEYNDIDDIKEKGCYIVRYYKRISQPSVRTTYNYYYLIVDVQDINVSQTLIGLDTFKSRSCKADNPWSEWKTGIVNPQPAILPREFLSLTSSSTSEEILTTLNLAGGAKAIATLFQERKGSIFLDNDENGLQTLIDYRKVSENNWELYYSYFEYYVLVEVSVWEDNEGTWHCEKNEYEIPRK